jgi:glycosyltransferase involved in cell wall biosynthesis
MNIAQVCAHYSPYIGGITSHVKKLSEGLVREGFKVDVVTTDPSGKLPRTEILNNVMVIRFRTLAPNNAYYFSPQVYNYLKKKRYTIIHAQGYHSFTSLFAALAKNDNKFVFTPHTFGFTRTFPRNIFHKLYMPFGRHIYDAADKVIAVSKLEGKWIQSTFKVPDGKLIYIPHPIEIPRKHRTSRANGTNGMNIFNVGFIGRLAPEKHVDVLIKAFNLLTKLHLKIKLIIVGNGPCIAQLKEMADSIEDIQFLGSVSPEKIKKILPSLDALVLPSEVEVSPVVVFEAIANNVAVIANPVGDLPLLLEHGKTCLFTKPLDPVDLARKIEILIKNPDLTNDIARNAKLLAEQKFDEGKVIDHYVSLFTRLANE